MYNIVTILPLKVLLLTMFCLGTVAHHLKITQICNILYLLIHEEPVSAFEEEKKNKEIKNLLLILLSIYRSFYFWLCLFYCFLIYLMT